MALPSSPNSLSINQIAGEFGGSVPHSLSEYYAGGGLTPSGISGDSGAIPTSGEISIGQFYGSANRVTINLTISSNTTNYQISSNRGGTYSSGITDIVLTNNAQVGSNAVGTAAIWTGAAPNWATGDTITIVNNGGIRGRGGNGGNGVAGPLSPAAQVGQAAGDAIEINYPVTVQNASPGQIRAGGGGGGGGDRGQTVTPGQPGNPPSKNPGQPGNPPTTQYFGGGGGGGGAGSQPGQGGTVGQPAGGQPGQDASATGGGTGGLSGGTTSPQFRAGAGGGNGQAGSAGQGAAGKAGGAAGKAVEPNGNQLALQNAGTVVGGTA